MASFGEPRGIRAESPSGAGIGTRQVNLALAIAGCLIVGGAGASFFAGVILPPVPGYMTAFGSAMIVINLLLASLLFSKGSVERRPDAIWLGAAYFFVATIFVPLTAAFPGGIVAGSLIGKPPSAVWLWSYWHGGFGLFILNYALGGRWRIFMSAQVRWVIAGVLALVTLLAMMSIVWVDQLPSIILQGQKLFSGWTGAIPATILAILAAGAVLVARQPDKTPEQLWLSVGMIAAFLDVWLTYLGAERFSVGWYSSKLGSLFTSLAVLISLFYDITRLYAEAAAANVKLQELADRDGLTGLANRRRFDQILEAERLRARRDGQPLSLLLIDVDHFKKFNDTYGHLEGDSCLRQVAAGIAGAIRRPGDMAARYGGEEFAVILPATPVRGAVEVAEAICTKIRAMSIPHAAGSAGIVTVSIGIAEIAAKDEGGLVLIERADRALYQAKAAGRDLAMTASA